MFKSLALLQALAGPVLGGTVLWDGRFNGMSTSSALLQWSWSDEVGPYQYYIHGSGPITEYVNLDPSYKNPADTSSAQGVKLTIDDTSYWNGQTMRRTELIPQTTAAINEGSVYYHFSMMLPATNAPNSALEHQVCFFESHFTEMKYGLLSSESGTSDTNLRWMVNSVSQWSTPYVAGEWHNVAYEINFSGNTVGFWHSTGSEPLTQVIAPMSVSTSSNGEDWHLGVLRLPMTSSLTQPDVEDWYFSGVYIESGTLTTSVSGPGGSTSTTGTGGSTGSSSSASAAPPKTMSTSIVPSKTSSATAPPASSPAAGGTLAMYSQCGGSTWMGSGTCVAGAVCKAQSSYYSQCLPA